MTTSRTFDITVTTKSGPEHTFSSINKEEHEGVEEYLKGKKLRVKNKIAEDLIVPALDDDDDEMQSVASSGEEVPRPRAGDEDEDSEEGTFCYKKSGWNVSAHNFFLLSLQTKTSRLPIATPEAPPLLRLIRKTAALRVHPMQVVTARLRERCRQPRRRKRRVVRKALRKRRKRLRRRKPRAVEVRTAKLPWMLMARKMTTNQRKRLSLSLGLGHERRRMARTVRRGKRQRGTKIKRKDYTDLNVMFSIFDFACKILHTLHSLFSVLVTYLALMYDYMYQMVHYILSFYILISFQIASQYFSEVELLDLEQAYSVIEMVSSNYLLTSVLLLIWIRSRSVLCTISKLRKLIDACIFKQKTVYVNQREDQYIVLYNPFIQTL